RCTISSSRHAGLVTALPATASPCSPTIPRRPRSTLFPYTTLFRSHHIGSDLRLYIRSSAHYGSEGWGFESSRVRHLKTVEKPPELREQHGRLLLWGAAEMPPPAAWQRSLASGHHKRSRRMKGCSPGDGEGPPERSGRSVSGGVVGCRARCGCSQRLPGPVVVQSAKT